MEKDIAIVEKELDEEILNRSVDLKDFMGSGDATLSLNENDSVETIGRLIKRALHHADGAIIKIRESNA